MVKQKEKDSFKAIVLKGNPFISRKLRDPDAHKYRKDFPKEIESIEGVLKGIAEVDGKYQDIGYPRPRGPPIFGPGRRSHPQVFTKDGLTVLDVEVNRERIQIGYLGMIFPDSIGHRITAYNGREYCRSGLELRRDYSDKSPYSSHLKPAALKKATTIMIYERVYDSKLKRSYGDSGTGTGR